MLFKKAHDRALGPNKGRKDPQPSSGGSGTMREQRESSAQSQNEIPRSGGKAISESAQVRSYFINDTNILFCNTPSDKAR